LTRRELRTVGIGLALIVLALAFRVGPAVLGWVRDGWWRLREERARLAEATRLVSQLPALDSTLSAERASFEVAAHDLVGGGSQAEAIAALGLRVANAVEAAGARLDQIEPLSDSTRRGSLSAIAVRIRLEGDLDGLMSLLADLETPGSGARVTALRLTAHDPLSDPAAPEVLRAEMMIRSWWRTVP